MNIRISNILRSLAALLLCVAAASCSQEELADGRGDAFAPGKYPLMFTATIDGMNSRADEGYEPWGDGDIIDVQIFEKTDDGERTDYPWIGYYVLNVDGTVKKCDEPLAWPYLKGYVKAWYPSVSPGKLPVTREILDQSNGYHDIDFMYAETSEEEMYSSSIDLQFRHLMTKVRCRFSKGDGVTEEDLKTIKVRYHGCSSVTFAKDGQLTGYGDGWIKSDSNYTALLVPQDMSEKPFIEVTLTVKVNDVPIDKTLTYTPKPGEVDLKAGMAYNFVLTVQKDRLETQTITGQWNDEMGSEYSDAVPRRVNLNFPGGKGPTLSFSENVTKGYNDTRAGGFPDYLIVKGREFTISYDVNDENAMMGIIPLIDDADKVKMSCLRIDEVYTFTYKFLSDDTVSLEYNEYAMVGDFYYSDGTWSRGLTKEKTPIGVVFRSGAAGTASAKNRYGVDTPENYDFDHPIRGYVIALNDVSPSVGFWGGLAKNNNPPYFIIEYDKEKAENYPENTRYSGYLNTQAIRTDANKLGSDTIYDNTDVNVISKYIDHFWAFKVACEYRPSNITDDNVPSAPSTSSGWYLPSIRQLMDIGECFQLKYCLLEAEGTAFDTAGAEYWSSSEYITTASQATLAHAYNIAKMLKNQSGKMSQKDYVRSVLTF